ncbi:MAG: response regulator transcription factor [Candidatus Acidiferrales bacterium]
MPASAQSARPSPPVKPRTILIADDSERVRTILRRVLERETPFSVCGEATDGAEAVTKARQLNPDLILLDLRMARLTGLEVAGILRKAQPNIRIIMVTMYADELNPTLASLFRVDAVFSKSDGITKLIEKVETILAA